MTTKIQILINFFVCVFGYLFVFIFSSFLCWVVYFGLVVYHESDKYYLVLSRLFSNFKAPIIINKRQKELVYYGGGFKIRK